MWFTFFRVGLIFLWLAFFSQPYLAIQIPHQPGTSQINPSDDTACLPGQWVRKAYPNLVVGKVIQTVVSKKYDTTTHYQSEVVVTNVLKGKPDLLDQKFSVKSYDGNFESDFQGIYPPLQPDEIGIWLVLSPLSGRRPIAILNGNFSHLFPCRKNVHPEFEQILEFAQIVSEVHQTAPELQTQLVRQYAVSLNREVSFFAVWWLLHSECPENVEYLKQMFFEGNLPVLSQLYFDRQMGNVYSKQPSAAEQWRNQAERMAWLFQLSQHRFDPREAQFFKSSCWDAIYTKSLNSNYFCGFMNRTAQNTSLPFNDRQELFHFAIHREVERKSLSEREAIDQYLWFIEQNVNQPGIDRTWYRLIFSPVTQPQIDRMSQSIKMTTNPEALKRCNCVWAMYRNLLLHSKCLPELK
ncbi:MAG: hypothetical protein HY774_16025 [Acidobacteria bacterium]|nr:hypothetical protein [Acidobacteriota bacterium]